MYSVQGQTDQSFSSGNKTMRQFMFQSENTVMHITRVETLLPFLFRLVTGILSPPGFRLYDLTTPSSSWKT